MFDIVLRISRDLSDEDLRMIGLVEILAGDLELFEQLLAFANTGEDDVNVFVRCQPGKSDHVFGEVDDLHGFAHVEDKYLSARTKSAGLQDELRRLRYRHEIPGHFLIRNRDRLSTFYLFAEDRNY